MRATICKVFQYNYDIKKIHKLFFRLYIGAFCTEQVGR